MTEDFYAQLDSINRVLKQFKVLFSGTREFKELYKSGYKYFVFGEKDGEPQYVTHLKCLCEIDCPKTHLKKKCVGVTGEIYYLTCEQLFQEDYRDEFHSMLLMLDKLHDSQKKINKNWEIRCY